MNYTLYFTSQQHENMINLVKNNTAGLTNNAKKTCKVFDYSEN